MSLTRREALRLGLAAAFSAPLGRNVLAVPAAPGQKASPPKGAARSVVQVWLWGGLSHLDSFDPKPEAGAAYHGPLSKPIATSVDGLLICEKLPGLAQRADRFAVIRGMTHGLNGHEVAAYKVQSGWPEGRDVHPSIGAVISKFRGYDAGYKGRIPPYIVLCEVQGRFSESGFLGSRYRPFATGGDPNAARFAVDGIVAEGITQERQMNRRQLLGSLDSLGKALPRHPMIETFDRAGSAAYEMILGDAGHVFDPAKETDAVRDRYGRNTFGQSCLVARRLVESGVPYVTINFKGWDTHKRHFEEMNRKLPELDQGLSALLDELGERGLLESTVIWCGGEFGRTPKVQPEAPWNGGRGHFGACFSTILAGGGFRGGRVLGKSDATGEKVAERPVKPEELLAAIYLKLGIDPYAPLPNERGIESTVLPVPEDPANLPLPELA
jgi:hypothetical protein